MSFKWELRIRDAGFLLFWLWEGVPAQRRQPQSPRPGSRRGRGASQPAREGQDLWASEHQHTLSTIFCHIVPLTYPQSPVKFIKQTNKQKAWSPCVSCALENSKESDSPEILATAHGRDGKRTRVLLLQIAFRRRGIPVPSEQSD